MQQHIWSLKHALRAPCVFPKFGVIQSTQLCESGGIISPSLTIGRGNLVESLITQPWTVWFCWNLVCGCIVGPRKRWNSYSVESLIIKSNMDGVQIGILTPAVLFSQLVQCPSPSNSISEVGWSLKIDSDISPIPPLIFTEATKSEIWRRSSPPVAYEFLSFRNRATYPKSKTKSESANDWPMSSP